MARREPRKLSTCVCARATSVTTNVFSIISKQGISWRMLVFASIKVWGVYGTFNCFVDEFSLAETITNDVTVYVASANLDSILLLIKSEIVHRKITIITKYITGWAFVELVFYLYGYSKHLRLVNGYWNSLNMCSSYYKDSRRSVNQGFTEVPLHVLSHTPTTHPSFVRN